MEVRVDTMTTVRMNFDSEQGMRKRNVPRVVVEVDVVPVNGKVIGGHAHIRGVGRAEVWVDDLGKVAAMLRRAGHEAAYAAAQQVAAKRRDEWVDAHARELRTMSPEAREEHVRLRCNEVPELYLSLFEAAVPGWRGATGMPPLRSAHVISRDETAAMPLDAFMTASAADREPFLIAAPATTESVQDQTAGYLRTIAEGLARQRAERDERAQRKAG
jgi:hypothetical protein